MDCFDFVMNLIPILNGLIHRHPCTNQQPIDVLLSTMSLDENIATDFIDAQNATSFEKWLYNCLEASVFTEVLNGFSADDTIARLDHSLSPWTIPGLSDDFPSREMLRWRSNRNRFAWKSMNSVETKDLWTAQGDSCRAFIRRYNRMPGQRLFLLESEEANLLGLGPDTLQTGDLVWASSGSEWPFVFRPREEDGETQNDDGIMGSSTYDFVGEAYIHGIMHGELFHHSAPQWQEVVLR